jgi:hypothetical protein
MVGVPFIFHSPVIATVIGCRKSLQLIPSNSPVDHIPTDVDETISQLRGQQSRGRDVLAIQSDYACLIRIGGGGSCATVTAFNALQVLRQMAGMELLNPHKVMIESFRAFPILLNGRVTDLDIQNLFGYYQKFFPDHSLNVRSEVGNVLMQSLTPTPGEVKILVYRVLRSHNEELGRHFIILKNSLGDKIVSFESSNPFVDSHYTVQMIQEPGAPQARGG